MSQKNQQTSISHSINSHGLNIHAVEWGQGDKTIVCHHGFLDHARTWHKIIEQLPDDYRVIAVDARGHGNSDWVGDGGYYHFQEYVRDLDAVINALVPEPCVLMGHSMGGRVSSVYAGTFPEKVTGLVLVEGSGPTTTEAGDYPKLMRAWIESTRTARQKERKPLASVQAAAERLQMSNPRLSDQLALDLATHGTEKIEQGFRWKFDPLHMSKSPLPVTLDIAKNFNSHFDKPVLIFRGSDSDAHCDTGENGGWPGSVALVDIEQAGHMIQHDNVPAMMESLLPFLEKVFS